MKAAYNQCTQFEEFPRFMEGVKEVQQLDDTHLHWKGQMIKTALADPVFSIATENRVPEDFRNKIARMTVPEFIDHIVELRGLLHHHTQRRKGIWHPEAQEPYESDALFLESFTFNVVFPMAAKYLDHPDILSMYRENMKERDSLR